MRKPMTEPRGLNRMERFLLRFFLRLYPGGFRERHRHEWMVFLEEQRKERRYRQPVWGAFRFWFDVFRDLAGSIPLARRQAREDGRRHAGERTRLPAPGALFQDLQFALRTFSRRPLFAAVAILTLGLGIGSATAMFSVVDGVLLADRQYTDPDRIVSIWQTIDGQPGYTAAGETRLHLPQYEALNQRSTAFEGVEVYAGGWGESTLSGEGPPGLVKVGAATALTSYFPARRVLRIDPQAVLKEE